MGGSSADARKVVRCAEESGNWTYDRKRGSHQQTTLVCVAESLPCRLTVYSTPRGNQPAVLRRRLRKCPHGLSVNC